VGTAKLRTATWQKERAIDIDVPYVSDFMLSNVDTKDPRAVQQEVQANYLATVPDGNPQFIPAAFGWALECFLGRYEDFQPIDAKYHDLEHTLQVTLCMSRLLKGRQGSGDTPIVDQHMLELGFLAILFHDSGYLKRRDDTEGTGAKYTLTHVSRSAIFAKHLLSKKKYGSSDILAVQNMIRCTGIDAKLEAIPFQSELEKIVGFALATSDFIGQMAAEDYIEKLPLLFTEFDESAKFNGEDIPPASRFESVDELLTKTPLFWMHYVKPKIENAFLGVHRYLDLLPPDEGGYIANIQANIDRLKYQLQNGNLQSAHQS
jgi:hypothetical protein